MAGDLSQRCSAEMMSKEVISVHPDNTLHEALVLLVENKISAMPVIEEDRRCLGMLSATDLVGMTRGRVVG